MIEKETIMLASIKAGKAFIIFPLQYHNSQSLINLPEEQPVPAREHST
jgi:hypothetical protein